MSFFTNRSARWLLAITVLIASGQVSAGLGGKVKTLKPAPSIELQDMDGSAITIQQFAGDVILVNFWATWCPPCLKELPSMQELWSKLQQRDFQMLAVNVGEDHDVVFAFLAEFDIELDFTVLLDETLTATKKWPVLGLPTTFLINRQGQIVNKILGERDWADPEIIAEIEKLLDE